MPIFDDDKLDRIRNIVRRHHLAAIARVAGLDSLTPEEQQFIADMGIVGEFDIYEEAYLFGQMTTLLEAAEAKALSYTQFKANLQTDPQAYALDEFQQRAVQAAKRQAAQYIRGLGHRVDADVGQEMLNAEEAQRQREMIAGEVADAIETSRQAASLSSRLRKKSGDYTKDWDKVSVTELHNARQHGIADTLRTRHGKGVRVFKQVMPDACKYCRALHIGPDGTPRIFKLDDLELTNIGRSKPDWQAVVGATHPHCQCETIHLPDGWGFDENGDLTPGGIYGIQFGTAEDVKKAVLEEQVLKKALKREPTVEFAGMTIRIENRAGSVRKWYDPEADEHGETKMLFPYGYVEGTQGSRAEGDDEYDVYVGPDPNAPFVFVVHQMDRNDNFASWDEDKAMLGFSNPHQAKTAYLAHYNDERFFGSMSMIPVEEFRAKVMQTDGEAEDGMVKSGPRLVLTKATTAVKTGLSRTGPTDNPTPPNYPAGPTLSMHQAAFTSQAGNRNVKDGTTGPNLLFRNPQPPHQGTDPGPRHKQLADWAKESADQAEQFRRQRTAPAKKLREAMTTNYTTPHVTGYADWEGRAKNDEAARKKAPERKAVVQTKLDERNRSKKVTPHRTSEAEASPHIRPEMLDDRQTRQAPPEITPKAKVVKKGLGEVALFTPGDRFVVQIGSDTTEFPSLSAACDHVWCLQKGYSSVDDFRAKTGKRKVPSGAGWKFWGIKAAS